MKDKCRDCLDRTKKKVCKLCRARIGRPFYREAPKFSVTGRGGFDVQMLYQQVSQMKPTAEAYRDFIAERVIGLLKQSGVCMVAIDRLPEFDFRELEQKIMEKMHNDSELKIICSNFVFGEQYGQLTLTKKGT